MRIAEITWQTSNPVASEDDVINEIREAIARRGYQVGDCVITRRDHTVGRAHVEVSEGVETLDTFAWGDVEAEVDSIEDDSPFL